MTDWAKKHFDDVPDRSPGDVDMQWRFARRDMGFEQVGVSRFTFPPGVRFPFAHRHRVQEEAYVVVAGSGRVKLDDEVVDVAVGEVLRVGPRVGRQFEAGPDGLELICVGGPLPESDSGGRGGDGEPVPDFWP